MSFDVPKEFGVPDEIGDMTRSLKWLRRKDRYIGRLYSDFRKVPSDSGIFRSTGELREFVLGLNGPYGKGEKGLKRWPHPSPWSGPNWTREGGRTLPSFSFPLPFSYSHKERRSPTPGGSRTPPYGAPLPLAGCLPLAPLYTGAGGTPETQQLILEIS